MMWNITDDRTEVRERSKTIPLVIRTTKRHRTCVENIFHEKKVRLHIENFESAFFLLGIARWRQFVRLSSIHLEKKNYSRLI